jgi:hypothetical protein
LTIIDEILGVRDNVVETHLFTFTLPNQVAPFVFEPGLADGSGTFRAIVGLDQIKVLLPLSMKRFTATARLRGAAGQVQFRIGSGFSQRQEFAASGSKRVWTPPFHMTSRIPAGVHDLTVLGQGNSSELWAFMLYGS